MFTIPQPDGILSDSDVKDLAKDLICQFPLPGVEGSSLDPGKIWAVVILAAVNQTSIWETCKGNDYTLCDDTVMDWFHTLNREWLERIANRLLTQLAMRILDPNWLRIVSINFVDNPHHGKYADEKLISRTRKTENNDVSPALYRIPRLERKAGDVGHDVHQLR